MAKEVKKILSVKEAFDSVSVQAEFLKDHGTYKVGDTAKMHKSTAEALRAHKVIK